MEHGQKWAPEKERFTSEKEDHFGTFKIIKKIIDDLPTIRSLTKTSADASRY
jgi:hypothetical protein